MIISGMSNMNGSIFEPCDKDFLLTLLTVEQSKISIKENDEVSKAAKILNIELLKDKIRSI